jgi:hypothetical protein
VGCSHHLGTHGVLLTVRRSCRTPGGVRQDHGLRLAPGARYRGVVTTIGPMRSLAARWVLAVVVVLGVLGMHALMGPPAAAGAAGPADGSMSMSVPGSHGVGSGSADVVQPATADGGSTPTGGHSPAGGHSMLTMCLAVIGSLAVLVLLVAAAMARRPARDDPAADVRPFVVRFSLGRPPPWTVPSLHQLSLLRV